MQRSLPLQAPKVGSILWQPQPDITAYELAQALPLLLLGPEYHHIKACMLVGFPDEVKRHFLYDLAEA